MPWATGLVLARVDFPVLLRAGETEQHFGDGAVAFAPQAGVERAQGEDMKLAKLRRHGAEVPAGCSAVERSPETASRTGANLHERIHREGYGIEGGCVRLGLGQPELMRNAIDMPDAMPPVRRMRRSRLDRWASVTIGSVTPSHVAPDTGERPAAIGSESRTRIGDQTGFRDHRGNRSPQRCEKISNSVAPGPFMQAMVWKSR